MFVRRSPAEFFIKFLLTKQEHDDATILRMLEEYGLVSISSNYIKGLGDKLSFPDPWEPTSVEGKKLLKAEGVYDLWFPNGQAKEAWEILAKPQLRSDTEQLLLSPLRIEEVTRRLNEHHSVSLSVEGVRAYGHYFWNKSLLPMHEWVALLEERPTRATDTTLLHSPPDMASTLVPWIVGMSGPPTNINTGTVSRRVRDVAFLKVLEIERSPATLAHSKMMKNYMDVIKAAEGELRQSDVALKDVLQAFEKFRLRKDDSPIPSLESIAGENFSKSGHGTGSHSGPLADDFDMEDDADGDDN